MIGIETPGGVVLTVGLQDIHVFAHPRILLKPLVNKIPCFSAMSISLMEAPKVDYKINALGLPITSVPGLADFLEGKREPSRVQSRWRWGEKKEKINSYLFL